MRVLSFDPGLRASRGRHESHSVAKAAETAAPSAPKGALSQVRTAYRIISGNGCRKCLTFKSVRVLFFSQTQDLPFVE
jgi:hypothetical protein